MWKTSKKPVDKWITLVDNRISTLFLQALLWISPVVFLIACEYRVDNYPGKNAFLKPFFR